MYNNIYQQFGYAPWDNYQINYGYPITCPKPEDCDFYNFYEKLNLGFKPADTISEYMHLIQQRPKNLIISPGELVHFMRENKFNLDRSTIESFEKSIRSDKYTIYGFKYSILTEKLTFNQFSELMARLGCSIKLFDERKDQICCIDPTSRWCWPCKGQYCHVQCPI
ncbi:hypothetical protein JUJ52_22735 [Virgibacillus sp. AGTR]|uniref:hypothetical protein n=1 Tax=Virgibacillus sp. AGTR TaxID=2812055 RepID=UPI001D169E6A|nr:hypothetical protein [Virgibacillus sp. AGTR]MCC2252742.1 hypothetical protein [Virgibacillus sp. AGTR]